LISFFRQDTEHVVNLFLSNREAARVLFQIRDFFLKLNEIETGTSSINSLQNFVGQLSMTSSINVVLRRIGKSTAIAHQGKEN
jgi:hypothetical protein